MSVALKDAWDKLRWAWKHLDDLRPEIEAFEKRDSHHVTVDVDKETGEYSFYVHGIDEPDPEWGLRIGDCLHNARTALDYLLVRLVAITTGQEPADIEIVTFPVFDDPDKFASRTGQLRKLPDFSGYLTRIEELQPFNAGNPSIWGRSAIKLPVLPPFWGYPDFAPIPTALQRLATLDNADKHRIVQASWVGASVTTFLPGVPADFSLIGCETILEPLEDGAKIGTWRFETPLPREWEPSQMEMKAHFTLEVGVAEPLPFNAVLEILPFCLGGVTAVLSMFEPVFSHGSPPLPVTALTLRVPFFERIREQTLRETLKLLKPE